MIRTPCGAAAGLLLTVIASLLLPADLSRLAHADEPVPTLREEAPRLPPASVHQHELELHHLTQPRPRPLLEPGLYPVDGPQVDRTVYGYFPYWAEGFDELQWDLLTHIAFFSVGIDGQGRVTERRGWPDAGFVASAHAHGVLVELAITLFDGDQILALCRDPVRRARAVQTIVQEVQAGGADGASIDFEGLIAGTRDHFSTFIEELRAGFVAAGQPDASISIAGPAVDWSQSFDLARLLPQINHYFIMGYGFHWRDSGQAGPVGQLRVGPLWRPTITNSMLRSLSQATRTISDSQRHQLVWGVPYYGTTWRTEGAEVPSATIGFIRNPAYRICRETMAGQVARRWEPEAANPWLLEPQANGGFYQTWFDDEESLAAKYRLIREQGAGVGMWALGYDAGYPELWDLLRREFAAPAPLPVAGTVEAPLPITEFPFQDRRDTREAPSCWFNYYDCAPDTAEYGREWVYSFSICQPGTLEAIVEDGPGVDVDLHLLAAPDQHRCLARHNTRLSVALEPGRYWLVVDTYVADHLVQAGAFPLTVDFRPAPGSVGCPPDTICEEGQCVGGCPAPLSRCGGQCVDLARHDLHCGRCDRACEAWQACTAGECVGEPEADAGQPSPDLGVDQADAGPTPGDSGPVNLTDGGPPPSDLGEAPDRGSTAWEEAARPDPDADHSGPPDLDRCARPDGGPYSSDQGLLPGDLGNQAQEEEAGCRCRLGQAPPTRIALLGLIFFTGLLLLRRRP